ncbi:hypothetical protein BDV09DRAFT_177764 [Aspergillus tetrazonus]
MLYSIHGGTQYHNIQHYVFTSFPLKGKAASTSPILICYSYKWKRISPYITHIINPGSDLLRLSAYREQPDGRHTLTMPKILLEPVCLNPFGLIVLVIRNNRQSHSLESLAFKLATEGKGQQSSRERNTSGVSIPQRGNTRHRSSETNGT